MPNIFGLLSIGVGLFLLSTGDERGRSGAGDGLLLVDSSTGSGGCTVTEMAPVRDNMNTLLYSMATLYEVNVQFLMVGWGKLTLTMKTVVNG